MRNPIFFGASAAIKLHEDWVLIAQVQGHQSTFDDEMESVGLLEGLLTSFHTGVRWRVGSYFIDMSVGTGGGDLPSDWIYTLGFDFLEY